MVEIGEWFKVKRAIVGSVVAIAACVQCFAGWKPALQFRLESDHTSSDEAWSRTFAMLREVPGLCDRCRTTSAEVQDLRDTLDARSGGTPAVLESPFVGMMLPRVAADGTLRNVALLNLRLDGQGPLRLRLRGVPSGVKQAVWREIRSEPKPLAVSRDGGVCHVEVPSLGAWNGGFLEF